MPNRTECSGKDKTSNSNAPRNEVEEAAAKVEASIEETLTYISV